MKDDFEVEEKKQAAADVLDQYSKFVMACIGNQVRPRDMRMHLRKEISGLPTSLKRDSFQSLGESSNTRTARLDKHPGSLVVRHQAEHELHLLASDYFPL